MVSERRANTIKSLIELYTVVIGVGLSFAVYGVVGSDNGLLGVSAHSVCLFVAFVATLFPFYHGALRHLYDAYLEQSNEHIRPAAVFPDFILLFLHALAFVVLALLLDKPGQFLWVLDAVLAIDVLWAAFTYFGASSKRGVSAEARWAVINLTFLVISLLFLVLNNIYLSEVEDPTKLAALIMIACVARSAWDYVWCRSFYFPD
jgi:hypothetical protein